MSRIHTTEQRMFVTLDGLAMTSGRSNNLVKGQFGIQDKGEAPNAQGNVITTNLPNFPKNRKFSLRLGMAETTPNRSQSNKAYSSMPFKLSDVEDISVSAPKNRGIKTDKLIIGYDGINDNTAISLENGDNEIININLSGKAISMLGNSHKGITVDLFLEAPNFGTKGTDWTDQEVILDAVKRFKNMTLQGNVPITEYIKIRPVDSTSPESLSAPTEYTVYELTVEDDGTLADLAAVQAQYPGLDVKQKDYRAGKSVYAFTQLTSADAPSDFTQTVTKTFIKDCNDCPAGTTAQDDKFIYQFNLTNASNKEAIIAELESVFSNHVDGTAQEVADGVFLIALDAEITGTQETAFGDSTVVDGTFTLNDNPDIKLCEGSTSTTTSWVTGGTLNAVAQTYKLQLPDSDCGENILAEVQENYPDLTITVDQGEGYGVSTEVTLTGSSGTADISFGSSDFTATFDTNLTTTASNFVTAHSSALSALGITVTSDAAVLTFADKAQNGEPTVTEGTGNLAGTVAEGTAIAGNVSNACQTVYETDVLTQPVSEECDPIFRDLFISEAPDDFKQTSWVLGENAFTADAKMGILIEGKENILAGGEYFRDEMPEIYSSTRLSVAGGQPTMISESFKTGRSGRMAVKLLEIATEPEQYGFQFYQLEDESRMYFEGRDRLANNYGRWVLGQETLLKPLAQYVVYTIKVKNNIYSGTFSGTSEQMLTYTVLAEVGKHEDVEGVVNALAQASGLPQVHAFPA